MNWQIKNAARFAVWFGSLWFALALSLLHDAKFELCYNSALFVLAATSDSCRARWRQNERARERDGARSGLGLLGVFFALLLLRFVCLFSFCADFFNVTFRIFPINLINCVVVVATFTQLFVLDCMFMHVETQPSQAGQTNGLRDSQTCVSTYGMPIRTQRHMAWIWIDSRL